MKQTKRFSSCLAILLACVLLFTGATYPPEHREPARAGAPVAMPAASIQRESAAPAAAQPAQPAVCSAAEAPAPASPAQKTANPPAEADLPRQPEQASAGQEVPAPPAETEPLPTFTPASAQFVREVLGAVITQILTGKADRNAVIDAIERLPMPQEQRAAFAAALSGGRASGSTIDILKGLIDAIDDGIRQIDITLGATPYPGVYEFLGDYVKDDGTPVHVSSGVYYDEATGLVYGKDGRGMIAIGFDYDAGQYLVVGAAQAWQRQFGFCRLYDILSPLVFMNYDTVRIKFRYDDRDWMVQLWKGNYAITNGGEIGIYHKPTDRLVDFYDCAADDELPQMAMTLRKGDQVLFTRGLQPHWWMTGFQLGTLYRPAQLTLDGQLVFADPGMRDAFVKAFKQQVCPLTSALSVEGDLVSFSWQ